MKPQIDITVQQRIVHDFYIEIDGMKLDAESLLDDLDGVAHGSVYIPASPAGEILVKIGVLKSRGGRDYPARPGEQFESFRSGLEGAVMRVREAL